MVGKVRSIKLRFTSTLEALSVPLDASKNILRFHFNFTMQNPVSIDF